MYQEVWKLIDESHYITLISHINPDGDTLGSALSFYPTLKNMGKNVSLVNLTKDISNKYDFLPNFKKIKNKMPEKCELVISFDCGSLDRLGIEKGSFKIINIDHHKSNTNFGDINIVEPDSASSTLVALSILQERQEISKNEAECIYTGLVEDTGFFTHSNTDKLAFEAASKLISIGVNPSVIAQNLKMRNSLAKIRLTTTFINSIELLNDAKIAVGVVREEDFKKTGALKSDSDHLVDILINLATVEVAIIVIQNVDNTIKVSLRSKNIDVSTIAESFGGGGHKKASGFELEDTDIQSVIKNIINKVNL